MKNSGKSFGKGKFSSSKSGKKEFKKKDGKDSSSTQGIMCYECNGHEHLKKECPNYLRGQGKCLLPPLVIPKAQIPTRKENVIVRETIQLSWQLQWLTLEMS